MPESLAEPIPPSEWRWCGYPAHFIGAHRCHFHLATRVGDWIVSTIGDYRPDGHNTEPEGLKNGHLYETLVFTAQDVEYCHAGAMAHPQEVASAVADESIGAERAHLAACERVATWPGVGAFRDVEASR